MENALRWMVKRIVTPFVFLILTGFLQGQTSENLFPDPDFQRGFLVIDGPKTLGVIQGPEMSGQNATSPIWKIAEHNSRYNLATTTPVQIHGGWEVSTPGSRFRFQRDKKGEVTVTLGVFAEKEYDAPRELNQPWLHLLLSTDYPLGEGIPLFEGKTVIFSADLRILESENRMAEGDYQESLHCGQVSAYFIFRNADPNSPDHFDYLWFGIPVFDSRYDVISPSSHIDGDPKTIGTGKLIWCPGGQEMIDRVYGGKNPRSGEWVHLEANLGDYVADALTEANRLGFMTHSKPEDLEIDHFNLGWEVPGTFHCEMEIRNPRLERR